MSVIIYGVRDYGRVDAYAGEHAQTKFFHIWFAPIFPVGSSWVTPTGGHSIKPSLKSIAAAYLRIWGPIAALGTLSVGIGELHAASFAGPGLLVAAACIAALSAWSWTWRNLRGASAQRRSDFNYVAFGTRCEPSRRFAADRSELKRNLDRRWNERAPSQSPNEVAAHGASDAGEAVLAYGLLRLSAIDRGKAGASDGADADRILHGQHTSPSVDDGPYRVGVSPTDAKTAAGLADLVNARAASNVIPPTKVDREWELRRAKRRSRLQFFGLLFLSAAAFAGVTGFFMAMRGTVPVTIKELRSANPPKTRIVELTCDEVEPPLWEEFNDRGKGSGETTARIAMCRVGKYLVPVKFPATGELPDHVVTGKLYDINSRDLWVREGLRKEPDIEAQTTDVYIDATRTGPDIAGGVFGLAFALVTPVLWVLWFRARRRRQATERALAAI